MTGLPGEPAAVPAPAARPRCRLYVGPAYGDELSREERADRERAARADEALPWPRRPREGPYLRAPGGELVWLGDEDCVLPVAWLAGVPLVETASVVRAAYRIQAGLGRRAPVGDVAAEAYFTTLTGEEFGALAQARDEELAPVEPVRLLIGDGLAVQVDTAAATAAGLAERDIEALARRLLGRAARSVAAELSAGTSRHDAVRVTAGLRPRTRMTVGQLVGAVRGLTGLLDLGPLDPDKAWTLLEAGRGDLLIGQQESWWLEAKSAPYRLGEFRQEVEAARDVAALANGGGGLLVCGMKTKRLPGGAEALNALAPIGEQAGRSHARHLARVLDRLVYPPVPGCARRS
jgi:hypothetical protein